MYTTPTAASANVCHQAPLNYRMGVQHADLFDMSIMPVLFVMDIMLILL
jgi:hypothetical protein